MKTKPFKSESKKLMDMMINSIYTHKEIFLREIISNASDALDKLYFRSLTDQTVGMKKNDFCINIEVDKAARLITVSDSGCGMTADELDKNLGTIAKSGSFDFKAENGETPKNVDIIGQFGVGLYSAFMVSDAVTVISRAFGENGANRWYSSGADGYTITPAERENAGTTVMMHIKDDAENENYSEFLDTYKIEELVKKYSDYIHYPIKMEVSEYKPKEKKDAADGEAPEYEEIKTVKTVNSMVPLWKREKRNIKKETYQSFYKEKYFDYEDAIRVIHYKTEGDATYTAMLFIPSHAPFDYYTKEYEKGLQLYSKGVMIMEKCDKTLPDHFSFVKGLIDSEDLTLNISRETLQHDSQIKLIAKTVEKKIKSELEKMLKTDRENYEKFFAAFGTQLKFGVYNNYGVYKEELKDLLLFDCSLDKKITLKEYIEGLKEGQEEIYYASGETIESVKMLPQSDSVVNNGFTVLYLTDAVDEFALKTLMEYDGKKFINVCDKELKLDGDKEKAASDKTESNKELLESAKNALDNKVSAVKYTAALGEHPVALTSEGAISLQMEKALNAMPGSDNRVKANLVLELNLSHPVCEKLEKLYKDDREKFDLAIKLLYDEACVVSGKKIDDPLFHAKAVCDLLID
ncbi:MAG: molecular chaperone HtpG [Oscillospiraceae bacterium]|nr:molecular chaperone HtpG [Candidatus Equicaccousia limihippi]